MDKKVHALLLDCDGTVAINAEDIHKKCVQQTLEKIFADCGKTMPGPDSAFNFDRVWQEQLGKGIANFYNTFIHPLPEHVKLAVSKNCSNSSEFEKTYEDHYCQLVASGTSGIQIRPGMKELIQKAKDEGITVMVVSNAKERVLRATLAAFNLHDGKDEFTFGKLDKIIGIDNIQTAGYEPKPAAGAYLYAMREVEKITGVPCVAENCIGVEDSGTGYASLKAAGIGTIVYCQNEPMHIVPEGIDIVIQPKDNINVALQKVMRNEPNPAMKDVVPFKQS